MLGLIKSGLAALAGVLDIAKWFQKRAERNEYREAGRNEQRLATTEAELERAKEANEIREDVARLPDAALDRELHRYTRPARSE